MAIQTATKYTTIHNHQKARPSFQSYLFFGLKIIGFNASGNELLYMVLF